MLQKILAAHPEIHTVSEPWIALHPLFALRDQGFTASFDQKVAAQGTRQFIRHLPEREDTYWEGVRQMLTYLYQRALEGSGKSIFLDKTPRYYFVIPELLRVFPHARFVFLLRNPVAVLSSILETWVNSPDAERLNHFWYDLMAAPRLILEGIRASGPHGIVARYEELTCTPETAVPQLCGNLGIIYYPSMIDYGAVPANQERWAYGDQGTVYDEIRPVADRSERWRCVLKQSPRWEAWALDYLKALGRGVVGDMGYSHEELCAGLTGPDKRARNEVRRDAVGAEPWDEPGTRDRLAETRGLLVERTAEMERIGEDLRARTAELVETRALLVARTAELERTLEDLQSRTAELVETRALLVARTGELERTVEDLQSRTAELVETRGLLVARTGELERTVEDLQTRTAELVETRGLLVARTAELERTVEDLQSRTAELVQTRGPLVERTRELERIGEDLRAGAAQLVETRLLLAQRDAEADLARESLQKLTAELDRLVEGLPEPTPIFGSRRKLITLKTNLCQLRKHLHDLEIRFEREHATMGFP